MKKILATLAMVGLLSGCAVGKVICKNKDSILTGLQAVISQSEAVIEVIKSDYPTAIPPAVELVLEQAQRAKNTATVALALVCPSVDSLTEAQEQMATAVNSAAKVGMKIGK